MNASNLTMFDLSIDILFMNKTEVFNDKTRGKYNYHCSVEGY
jgi:hypothetical protein